MPNVTLRVAVHAETETLVALLEDALTNESTRRAMLADDGLTAYAVCQNKEVVGAVVVRWSDEAEIELLAVDRTRRGQGIGRAAVAAVVEESRRRGVKRVLVGTGNFSLGNIAFYQKCGFRMSHIRRGFFEDVQPPEAWGGITLRDMIVFDYDLTSEAPST